MRKLILTALAVPSLAGHAVMAEMIDMQIDGRSYAVVLFDNDASSAFIEHLPLTLQFEDFGTTERIAYLKQSLKTGGAPTSMTPVPGDLAYYRPWANLAVFVRPFRHSEDLVSLGRLSPEGLAALARSGNHPVTFARGVEGGHD